jgi:hypothetical protein
MSVEEVREMLRAGGLDGRKIKNRWRVSESSLEAHVTAGERVAPQERGEIAQALFRVLGGTRPARKG